MALLTTIPTSMTDADEGDDADIDAGDEDSHHHADEGQRDGEEHDEGVDQRLEGCGHDEIDEEDRQRQGEAEAGKRGLHLVDLTAEFGQDPRGWRVGREQRLDVADRRAEAAALEIGAQDRGPLLLDAVDLGRTAILPDLGDGEQPQLTAVGTRDHEVADIVRRSTLLLEVPHPDVDLPVGLAKAGGDRSQDPVAQGLGDDAHVEPEGGQPVAVEDDLELGVALLEGGTDIHQTGHGRQLVRQHRRPCGERLRDRRRTG